jgi:hypothetical protein
MVLFVSVWVDVFVVIVWLPCPVFVPTVGATSKFHGSVDVMRAGEAGRKAPPDW